MMCTDATLPSDFAMSAVAKTETYLEHFKRRAVEVFENDAKAERWMQCQIPALSDKKPIDLITTQEGRDAVEATLVRIETGTF